jgi:hypothetical protein
MILHIADDEKFLDHSIAVFEAVNAGKNIYLVNKNTSLVYIKSRHENMICHEYGSKEYAKIINDHRNIEAVVFHDLIHSYKWQLIHEFSKNTHIHWMCYGSELYNIPYLRGSLYLPLTKNFIKKNTRASITERIEERMPLTYNSIYHTFKNNTTQFVQFKKSVERCNSFSSPIVDEIIYVEKYLNPKIDFILFHHIILEKLVSYVKGTVCTQQDFLVGNSANPSCNHLDTFMKLKEINCDQNVYVPLSYPKNARYIEKVQSNGKEIFGDQFKPLTEFLSLPEYSNILKRCGNVVLNFNRQQGTSNIVLAMYLGAKVYLNNDNISYNYLKSLGLKFYDLSELPANFKLENNMDLANYNRKILQEIYGEIAVLDATKNLVNKLEG